MTFLSELDLVEPSPFALLSAQVLAESFVLLPFLAELDQDESCLVVSCAELDLEVTLSWLDLFGRVLATPSPVVFPAEEDLEFLLKTCRAGLTLVQFSPPSYLAVLGQAVLFPQELPSELALVLLSHLVFLAALVLARSLSRASLVGFVQGQILQQAVLVVRDQVDILPSVYPFALVQVQAFLGAFRAGEHLELPWWHWVPFALDLATLSPLEQLLRLVFPVAVALVTPLSQATPFGLVLRQFSILASPVEPVLELTLMVALPFGSDQENFWLQVIPDFPSVPDQGQPCLLLFPVELDQGLFLLFLAVSVLVGLLHQVVLFEQDLGKTSEQAFPAALVQAAFLQHVFRVDELREAVLRWIVSSALILVAAFLCLSE